MLSEFVDKKWASRLSRSMGRSNPFDDQEHDHISRSIKRSKIFIFSDTSEYKWIEDAEASRLAVSLVKSPPHDANPDALTACIADCQHSSCFLKL
jgi:hypothetical protein